MNETGTIALGAADLALACGLVLVAGLVSVALKLGLEKRLALAAVRTVVQLLAVGYVLRSIFGLDNLAAVLALALLMIVAASRAAIGRVSRTFAGAAWQTFATLLLTGLVTSVTVTGLVIDVEPFWKPRYLIPLLGMILGNGLTGISLCLDTLLEQLADRSHEVEMELAHGATRWEAARGPVREAVRRGMIPIINTMMVVGIVALPGMMTGQILAGADPVEAVKYQIVVMFMIAGATSLGSISAALLAYRRLFDDRHRLRHDRIRRREP
jgi:putative ABC transport system permease protein